jgi:hypothetical protein
MVDLASRWCYNDTMPDTTMTERRITLRIPPILAIRVLRIVSERRMAQRKFSMNDWIIEAMSAHADRACPVAVGGHSTEAGPRYVPIDEASL